MCFVFVGYAWRFQAKAHEVGAAITIQEQALIAADFKNDDRVEICAAESAC